LAIRYRDVGARLGPDSTLDAEVIEMSKRNRINARLATGLAICAVVASVSATSYAQTGHSVAKVTVVEPGGGGH
jgi:hypothetical protein